MLIRGLTSTDHIICLCLHSNLSVKMELRPEPNELFARWATSQDTHIHFSLQALPVVEACATSGCCYIATWRGSQEFSTPCAKGVFSTTLSEVVAVIGLLLYVGEYFSPWKVDPNCCTSYVTPWVQHGAKGSVGSEGHHRGVFLRQDLGRPLRCHGEGEEVVEP